nr:hypothetical protein [uncultured Lichenicoccus sp.]
MVTNPFALASGGVVVAVGATSTGLGVVDGRAGTLAETDDIEKNSLDEYAALRSVTEQNRAAFVEQGRIGKVRPADTGHLKLALAAAPSPDNPARAP